MLAKIISGGQSGGDRGGLRGAVRCGIPTGGTAPRGWRTDEGPRPDLAFLGLVEHASADYLPRTAANVMDADGTLFVGRESPGEAATRRYAREAHLPYLRVSFPGGDVNVGAIAAWLERHKIRVLNVAGNRERTNPGIEQFTLDLIYAVQRHA